MWFPVDAGGKDQPALKLLMTLPVDAPPARALASRPVSIDAAGKDLMTP